MMKRIYKYLFIVTFVISSFLFINKVDADYKASAVNTGTPHCNLYNGNSTGYCYYKNSNLNSYVDWVIWLDNGDEVTVLTDYNKVESPNKTLCSDYYVYTSYHSPVNGQTYYGYYCNAYLDSGEIDNELREELSGFPESYIGKLAVLKKAHPNWSFVPLDTELDFNTVVNAENTLGRSLLQVTSSTNNQGYLNTWSGSYNYYTDTFTAFDGSNWYAANYDTIAFYLDPRNFLNDTDIFQFEKLSYDSSISEETYKTAINAIFKDDYLSNYTNDFYNAGKDNNVKVNPIYLASLSFQEINNGLTPGTAISGSYNGMYNFYNIGATSGENPVYNGLDFAAIEDADSLRPWDTPYKAIAGGAKWIAKNYINIGQDTIYFKKWDVVSNINSNSGSDFYHQYQTNIQAAVKESNTTKRSYASAGILDLNYVFYIPIYNKMPVSTSLPAKGNPNNYLSNLKINGQKVADFDGGVENYNYNLDINTPKLKLEATSVNSNATISGLGTFDITEDTTKTITVTAQNGAIKKYNINIKLTGTKLEEPTNVVITLNNAGIKNGNKYISGIILNSDINNIKTKILNANKHAIVALKNKNNQEKNSGKVATGDKVVITVGSETKEYEIVIYGDVNGDGSITPSDYARVKNTFLKKSSLSGAYKEAADANKSGTITASDYAKVKNAFLGKSTIQQ